MPIPPALHVAAWVALGAGVATVLVRQEDLDRRLVAATAAGFAAPPAAEEDRERQVADLRGRLEAAERSREVSLSEIRAEVQKVWAELLRAPDGAAAAGGGPEAPFVERPGFEDAVRAVIDRYAVEHRFRDAIKKATGPLVPKKPKFAELAKALELRPPQAERLSEDVRAIQQELYAILQVPRADGVVPLEEIVQAEQYAPGDPKRGEVFLRLMRLTIPETQETYFERAITLVQRVKEGTKSYLDVAQRDTLDTIDLDWFGIQLD